MQQQDTDIERLKNTYSRLGARDAEFAASLIAQLERRGSLSERQWPYVKILADRAEAVEAAKKIAKEETTINIGAMHGLIELFNRARKHLKNPKIRLETPTGVPVVVKVMGANSRNAGHIGVSNGGPFGANLWFGTVSPEGEWRPSGSAFVATHIGAVGTVLSELATRPTETAAAYGRLKGTCCFCTRPLSDERSTSVGYGPICAGRWGLPWG